MASINYLLIKGSRDTASIYVRFQNGKGVDFKTVTGISINRKIWKEKEQIVKGGRDSRPRAEINLQLNKLKVFLLEESSLDYMKGIIIDQKWLKEAVPRFFERPKGEVGMKIAKHAINLSDFADWWIENQASKWKVSAGKFMDEKTIGQYSAVIKIIKKFENEINVKIKLREIDSDILDRFSHFLTNAGYAPITSRRTIGRLKFFCTRAEELGYSINKNYKQRVFVEEQEAYLHPYLNEQEIKAIYEYDFSHDEELDNIRDLFVISLNTGLRISDFNHKLGLDNIKNDCIEIRTSKTKHAVSIPIHFHIKTILKKRHGMLPYKVSDKTFNEKIRLICQLADIDEEMPGAIIKVNKKTGEKRKVFGNYPKHRLITSHSARRTLCTLLFGKVPNKTILDVLGWVSEKQLLHYVKTTRRESADTLKAYWDNKY